MQRASRRGGARIGFVFQSYALWPHMTRARERGLRAAAARAAAGGGGGARRGPRSSASAWARWPDAIPGQLSGGQQQRVSLARALVLEPDVLLLDEPLSNLDAQLRVEMRREIRRLQREVGITTIYVTHDQEEALAALGRDRGDEPGARRAGGDARRRSTRARARRSWPPRSARPTLLRGAGAGRRVAASSAGIGCPSGSRIRSPAARCGSRSGRRA